MDIRYQDVSNDIIELASQLVQLHFSHFEKQNITIKYLFDVKKKLHNGKLVLGTCYKSNDLVRHLTIEEASNEFGYDYVIILDKIVYQNASPDDRIRIIRHELRHVDKDEYTEKCYINPHNIEDFIEEIELNMDKPRWASELTSTALEIYEEIDNKN